ncbi:response regulator transcription factor [Paenibacillus cymbidii]|uniref:response regulator transcription factor n=1 Tax=Paenibacillus cymbidii TaxID=1639034 RepID=UPI0010816351|nr:response regulator transcription factor [Paenibacillus cymbidii]
MEETIRVFICEDDPVFRRLLAKRLAREPDLAVVGDADGKETLLAAMRSVSFDVLLLDLNLTDKNMEGLEIALELRGGGTGEHGPLPKIIVLSSVEEEEIVAHTLGFGRVANYITKEFTDDIPSAVRDAFRGRSGIHHSAAGMVLNALGSQQERELRKKITPKQVQILKLQAAGYSRKEIADLLFYSEYTINNELCKVSSVLKGKFPYLEWLRLKKHNSREILQLAKQLHII